MIILINNELWQVIVYSDVVCPNITKKSKNPRTVKKSKDCPWIRHDHILGEIPEGLGHFIFSCTKNMITKNATN